MQAFRKWLIKNLESLGCDADVIGPYLISILEDSDLDDKIAILSQVLHDSVANEVEPDALDLAVKEIESLFSNPELIPPEFFDEPAEKPADQNIDRNVSDKNVLASTAAGDCPHSESNARPHQQDGSDDRHDCNPHQSESGHVDGWVEESRWSRTDEYDDENEYYEQNEPAVWSEGYYDHDGQLGTDDQEGGNLAAFGCEEGYDEGEYEWWEEEDDDEALRDCWVLWVGSLSPRAHEGDLLDAFGSFGPILALSVRPQQGEGVYDSLGLVTFAEQHAAEAAFAAMSAAEICGARIRLRAPQLKQVLCRARPLNAGPEWGAPPSYDPAGRRPPPGDDEQHAFPALPLSSPASSRDGPGPGSGRGSWLSPASPASWAQAAASPPAPRAGSASRSPAGDGVPGALGPPLAVGEYFCNGLRHPSLTFRACQAGQPPPEQHTPRTMQLPLRQGSGSVSVRGDWGEW
jgi:hypothetical protein